MIRLIGSNVLCIVSISILDMFITFKMWKLYLYKNNMKPSNTKRTCIISTNLDTMIRLIYMISILIIYMYTSYIYIYMGNRLLVYEYNNHKDDRLRRVVSAHITNSLSPLFIEVPALSQERERSCT
jgi:hypothetical protein